MCSRARAHRKKNDPDCPPPSLRDLALQRVLDYIRNGMILIQSTPDFGQLKFDDGAERFGRLLRSLPDGLDRLVLEQVRELGGDIANRTFVRDKCLSVPCIEVADMHNRADMGYWTSILVAHPLKSLDASAAGPNLHEPAADTVKFSPGVLDRLGMGAARGLLRLNVSRQPFRDLPCNAFACFHALQVLNLDGVRVVRAAGASSVGGWVGVGAGPGPGAGLGLGLGWGWGWGWSWGLAAKPWWGRHPGAPWSHPSHSWRTLVPPVSLLAHPGPTLLTLALAPRAPWSHPAHPPSRFWRTVLTLAHSPACHFLVFCAAGPSGGFTRGRDEPPPLPP